MADRFRVGDPTMTPEALLIAYEGLPPDVPLRVAFERGRNPARLGTLDSRTREGKAFRDGRRVSEWERRRGCDG